MRRGRPEWERAYASRLIVTDVFVVLASVTCAQMIWYGADGGDLQLGGRNEAAVAYTAVSVILASIWLLMLRVSETRDRRVIGSGSLEYKRVTDATFALFGLFAIIAYLGKIELGRGYFLTALPFGLFFLLLSRWLWRQWLHGKRVHGQFTTSVLLVGSDAKVEHVARSIRTERSAGLTVVAVLLPNGKAGMSVAGVPVLGDFTDILPALDDSGAMTIVLTDSDDLPHEAVRTLSWDLEARGINLIVVPALTDVAGPRIHARPVSGLPLIHVEFPTFAGRKHLAKRAFDILFSASALVALSPVLVVIGIAVVVSSPGPALFRQERVGLNGKHFQMLKFRSMVTNAEAQLPSLLDQSDGNGLLFKLKSDPRVTRVGRFLRRHSLDELPQLLNVFAGSMSLVGPRPPLASEAALYDVATRRRLLVKPGITGLWQVSGRSNLSWEDSVRLDLFYVENWSFTGDLILLYRTVKTVIRPNGAY